MESAAPLDPTIPPPPIDLDAPPAPAPGAPAQAPAYNPLEIQAAGEQLGNMVAMGMGLGFKLSGLRTLDEKEASALKDSAIRYAHARPRLVVGGTRFLPELDFFGSILALAVLRAMEPPPEKPKAPDEQPPPPSELGTLGSA